MNHERKGGPHETPYWHADEALGEAVLGRSTQTIRLKLHQSEERFRRHDEIIPLSQPSGTRTYVHAKPYILVPDIRMTVGFYPTPEPYGAIGKVLSTEQRGQRAVEIGQAQAWYYPADRVVMLWECYLFDAHRQPDPLQDSALATLWTGFERTLLGRLPQAQWLVTTWEDTYERSAWQFFLSRRGYQPFTAATFAKTRGA